MPAAPAVPLTAVPDVLGPGLRAVFCGINPGRASAEAGFAFANPRNDFWRLLHDAGFTPRLLAASEQASLLELGYGLTNAARRTTRGSSDLRSKDFDGAAERLETLAAELRPLVIAFVGKAAYQGPFRERADLGLQERRFPTTLLYVLPSTSPANAAVPYPERLRWFEALARMLDPPVRRATRAIVLDEGDHVLLYRFLSPGGVTFWGAPGGGLEKGESWEDGLRRELDEEIGLANAKVGALLAERDHVFVWHGVVRQHDRCHVVRATRSELTPERGVGTEEAMQEYRWWTAAELERFSEEVWPANLPELVRTASRASGS